jgi:hypothetical protein
MRIQACCLHCVTFACNVYSVITGVYCNNTDHAVNPWLWYVCPPLPSAAVYSLLTNVNIWEEYNTQFPHHACKSIVMNTCISMHSTLPVRYEGGEMFWKISLLLHYCGDFSIDYYYYYYYYHHHHQFISPFKQCKILSPPNASIFISAVFVSSYINSIN